MGAASRKAENEEGGGRGGGTKTGAEDRPGAKTGAKKRPSRSSSSTDPMPFVEVRVGEREEKGEARTGWRSKGGGSRPRERARG